MASAKSEENVLVVLGATGSQGGAVLRYFANQKPVPGFRLRGLSRRTDSKASQALRDLGVEMVQADLDDSASLRDALVGATHLFANTDSNQNIVAAIKDPSLLKTGQTPRTYAKDIELNQGKNIAEAVASTATLKSVVWSSLTSPKKWSRGKYTEVTMFDAKEEIADMFEATPALQGKLRTLQVGFYATNALNQTDFFAPKKQPDGAYELAFPMSGDKPVPHADLDADLGRWVAALFAASPGTVLVGATESFSWREWLALWGARNGVAVRYARAEPAAFAARMPGFTEAMADEFQFTDEFGYTGGNPRVVWPDDLRREGVAIEQSSIRDQIQRTDWSSIL